MQNNVDRVKQFLPFDALTGFREAIELVNRNIDIVSKKDLGVDYIEFLNTKLNNINKNDTLLIKYYYENEYIETIDILKKIDDINKILILKNNKIKIEDILDIEVINE